MISSQTDRKPTLDTFRRDQISRMDRDQLLALAAAGHRTDGRSEAMQEVHLARALLLAAERGQDAVPCHACHRPITECAGDGLCEKARKGAGDPYPQEALETYTISRPLFGRGEGEDYRARALENDPSLTVQIERMSGSYSLCFVIRAANGGQVTHAPREACAWAGASGATRNTRYREWHYGEMAADTAAALERIVRAPADDPAVFNLGDQALRFLLTNGLIVQTDRPRTGGYQNPTRTAYRATDAGRDKLTAHIHGDDPLGDFHGRND